MPGVMVRVMAGLCVGGYDYVARVRVMAGLCLCGAYDYVARVRVMAGLCVCGGYDYVARVRVMAGKCTTQRRRTCHRHSRAPHNGYIQPIRCAESSWCANKHGLIDSSVCFIGGQCRASVGVPMWSDRVLKWTVCFIGGACVIDRHMLSADSNASY